MSRVKISPKYQVVIPKDLREVLHLQPGEQAEMLLYDNRIEIIPVRNIRAMRGFLKGMPNRFEREPDRV